MSRQLSQTRLYAMRALYLLTAIVVGVAVWPELIHPAKPWDPMVGVAYSLYGAFTLLMLLGVRFPVKLLPLLLMQLLYKTIWLIAVGYPLWSAGHLDPITNGAIKAFIPAIAADLLVIPWPYVVEEYFRAPAVS